MTVQTEFNLKPFSRGCHLITSYVTNKLPKLPQAGILHLFIKHTSAGLALNENADPDVQTDMALILDKLIKERESFYTHTLEGDDDMPAHAKSVIVGSSITIPISNGLLNLGIWQGIYLCEFRNHASGRSLVATIIGD